MAGRFLKIVCGMLLLPTVFFGQTYKGKGDSPGGVYRSALKINPDSSVFFNYYDERGNCVFADFKGLIKRTGDSVYQIKCNRVFGQYFMMNTYENKLTIVLDSGAMNLFPIKKIHVKYPDKSDTTFHLKLLKKSHVGVAAVHDIYKNKNTDDVVVDVGYRDIIFQKKVLFNLNSRSALNFHGPDALTFNVKIAGNTIKTVGKPILQTGHLTLTRIQSK